MNQSKRGLCWRGHQVQQSVEGNPLPTKRCLVQVVVGGSLLKGLPCLVCAHELEEHISVPC